MVTRAAGEGPSDIADSGVGNLGAIANLVQYFGGSKTAGTTNATTSGATGPLQSLFDSTQDPNNLLALVQNLFSQGALQVPGLTTQYANATGTRVDNNTMLASSLAQLNQTLAQSIAQAAVNQQAQVALPAATQIARSNTAASEGKQTQTKPGDNAGNAVAGTLLAGLALRQMDNLKGGKTTATTGTPPDATPTLGGATPGPTPFPTSYDSPGATAPVSVPAVDNLNLGGAAIGVQDFGNEASLQTPVPDVAIQPEQDYDSINFDTAGTEGSFDFAGAGDIDPTDFSGFFLKDGGLVSRERLEKFAIKSPPQRSAYKDGGVIKKGGYADGGQIRGRPDFGPATPTARTSALNFAPPTATTAATSAPKKIKAPTVPGAIPDTGGDTASFDLSGEQGHTAFGPIEGSVTPGQMASVALAALSATNPASFVAAAFPGLISATIARGVTAALTGALTGPAGVAPDAGFFGDPSGNFGNPTGIGDPATSGTTGVAPESSASPSMTAGAGFFGDPSGNFGDQAGTGSSSPSGSTAPDAGVDLGDFSGLGSVDFSGSTGDPGAGTGGTEGGGEGGGSEGGGEKDGGIISTIHKSQKGIDRIPIHATEGEYMLPVDVTNYLGVENLDALVAALHTPY